jgi:hypothetical protein
MALKIIGLVSDANLVLLVRESDLNRMRESARPEKVANGKQEIQPALVCIPVVLTCRS